MTRGKPHQAPKMPAFKTRAEMAEFWDTHDTTDFEGEWEPVKVRFAKNLSESLAIRLDTGTVAKLREKAHEKGIGPTTLIRMWVLERLRDEESRSAQRG